MRKGQIPMNKLQWGSQKKRGNILQNKKKRLARLTEAKSYQLQIFSKVMGNVEYLID